MFLYEDKITECVVAEMQRVLKGVGESRKYMTQMLLPGVSEREVRPASICMFFFLGGGEMMCSDENA